MKSVVLNIIKIIVITLITCMSVCLLYYINKLNVIKFNYSIIINILVILIMLLIIFKLTRKKTRLFSKIVFGVISVFLSFMYLFIILYAKQTITFVDNMTNINYEFQKYSVLVLNDSGYNSINDLENKKIGFISTNINLKQTIKKLKEEVDYKNVKYDDIGTMISNIYDKSVEALVLDESYIDMLEENNVEFLNDSKEIYSFKVRVKKKDTRKKIDVNKDPFIIYISGSDSRNGIKAIARSDVNIVAVVNPNTNKILLVSIPRDYYVQLHGTTGTKDKLTHAGIYGVDKSKTTIEDLLDININYYAKVSFSTVINVVDVIDGINVYSEKAFKPKANKNCDIVEGTQLLNGECALAFARERYAYTTGDRHRGENQQAVISAIISKLNNPKYLVKYRDILQAADGSFETDLSYEEITSLVKYQLSELKSWSVESISLDGTGASLPTYSMGSQKLYVMIPNESTITNAKIKISEYLGN